MAESTIVTTLRSKRGELFALCNAALAEAPEGLDTRELARAVIRAKRLDENDYVLRKAIGFRVVQVMLRQEIRGCIIGAGKRRGVTMWVEVGTQRAWDNNRYRAANGCNPEASART
jgi:hypothetical protein